MSYYGEDFIREKTFDVLDRAVQLELMAFLKIDQDQIAQALDLVDKTGKLRIEYEQIMGEM